MRFRRATFRTPFGNSTGELTRNSQLETFRPVGPGIMRHFCLAAAANVKWSRLDECVCVAKEAFSRCMPLRWVMAGFIFFSPAPSDFIVRFKAINIKRLAKNGKNIASRNEREALMDGFGSFSSFPSAIWGYFFVVG